jgi:hypothetical protein
MRRFGTAAVAVAATMATLAAPAAAHNQTVRPPGNDKVIQHWVGAGDVPGQGEGLIPGGPGGTLTLTPAHAKGLVEACERLEANPSVVDIRGPGGPACPHGQ